MRMRTDHFHAKTQVFLTEFTDKVGTRDQPPSRSIEKICVATTRMRDSLNLGGHPKPMPRSRRDEISVPPDPPPLDELDGLFGDQ